MIAKWFNVNENARIWAGHSDAHKQGWLRAPGAILAVEEYKGSYRFDDWKVEGEGSGDFAGGDFATDLSYPETWIRIADVSLVPFDGQDEDDASDDMDSPPPPPPPITALPGDGELGAALRILGYFISNVLKGQL